MKKLTEEKHGSMREERMAPYRTGTLDITRISKENNLKEPEFEQNESFKKIVYRPASVQVPTKHLLSIHQAPTKHL